MEEWPEGRECHVMVLCTKTQNDSDSDEDVTKPSHQKKRRKLTVLEEKNKRVESTISSLCEKHGNRFTIIQYRLWGND